VFCDAFDRDGVAVPIHRRSSSYLRNTWWSLVDFSHLGFRVVSFAELLGMRICPAEKTLRKHVAELIALGLVEDLGGDQFAIPKAVRVALKRNAYYGDLSYE
jgi:hypothetical protein